MAQNSAHSRGNPFSRTASPSSSPVGVTGRPKSAIISSPFSTSQNQGHSRHQSYSSLATVAAPNNGGIRKRSKTGLSMSSTFAPSFIKTEDLRRGSEIVNGIEGENDFSGKRYVWVKDPVAAFVKGWIVDDLGNNQILVQCDDGSVCTPLGSSLNNYLHSHSSAKSTPIQLTRSILQNSTRLRIWRSSHI
jgi:myosin heavy chain 9/10/11/14